MSDLNRSILRWIILIGAAPIWWPFLKALWSDFNYALREEGGLMGRPPSPTELEKLKRETSTREDSLVSEPWVRPGEQRVTRMKTPAANRPKTRNAPAAGPNASFKKSSSERPRGFRR